jgi:hypothetical protein
MPRPDELSKANASTWIGFRLRAVAHPTPTPNMKPGARYKLAGARHPSHVHRPEAKVKETGKKPGGKSAPTVLTAAAAYCSP